MPSARKNSLYDVMAAAFPELELFELDGDRQLVRSRAGQLRFESIGAVLPLSGRARIPLPDGMYLVSVFPTHPGYVCAAVKEAPKGELDLEAAVTTVAELYLSVDEQQDDERGQSNGTTFLAHLFQTGASDATNITLMAADMDLDLSLRRIVAVFQITPPGALDQAEEALRDAIGLNQQDIFGAVGEDCVVCCRIIESGKESGPEPLQEFFAKVMGAVSLPPPVHISCGVGVPVSAMWEYPMALRMAKLALSEDQPISWAYEHILEYAADRLPQETIYHFLGQYFIYLDNNPTMYDTVHALVKRDMDLAAAASDCSVHRNTLVFRLNQLRSVWNINPIQNDNDRFFLILLDHCYSMRRREEEDGSRD